MNSEGSCPAVSCPLRTLCIVSLLFLSNNLSILSNIDCNFLIALVVIFLIILIFGSPLCKPSVKPTKKTRFFSLSSLKYGLLWMFKVFHVFLCHDDVIYWPKTPHLYWLLFWFFFFVQLSIRFQPLINILACHHHHHHPSPGSHHHLLPCYPFDPVY